MVGTRRNHPLRTGGASAEWKLCAIGLGLSVVIARERGDRCDPAISRRGAAPTITSLALATTMYTVGQWNELLCSFLAKSKLGGLVSAKKLFHPKTIVIVSGDSLH